MLNLPCPCGSGTKYKRCCGTFHRGAPIPNALLLMKARYSAYAVGDTKFLIATTHPQNEQYEADHAHWAQALQRFCRATRLTGLTIRAYVDGADDASVTFHAAMQHGSEDASFAERSRFVREDDRWFYRDGERLLR